MKKDKQHKLKPSEVIDTKGTLKIRMLDKISNKELSKRIAYFVADQEYDEIKDPEILKVKIEEFLNSFLK